MTRPTVTRSSTSSVLNTLERDGFVDRRRVSADRRLVSAQLTERGHKLMLEPSNNMRSSRTGGHPS